MCNCEYASRQPGGAFFCAKFKLYGWDGPLNVCTLLRIQETWDARQSRVPRAVTEREISYLNAVSSKSRRYLHA